MRRHMSTELRIIPIRGIGDIHPGEDLGLTIYEALRKQDLQIEQGDIIVVTQKIVSKAEGRAVSLSKERMVFVGNVIGAVARPG